MVTFRKTRNSVWLGNGFGDTNASWDAVVQGTIIATYDGDSRRGTQLIGCTTFFGGPTRWKQAIKNQVARKVIAAMVGYTLYRFGA